MRGSVLKTLGKKAATQAALPVFPRYAATCLAIMQYRQAAVHQAGSLKPITR
jgi:hypothetical protein